MNRLKLATLAFLFPLAGFTIIGCGSTVATPAPLHENVKIKGSAHGGQQPISHSLIQIYAAGDTPGGPAIPLVQETVYTSDNGSFELPSPPVCPSGSVQTWITATGGNPGLAPGQNNSAVSLMAVLGPCGNLTPSTFVSVNELTTVAAAYALAPMMTSYNSLGLLPEQQQEVTDAVTSSMELVNPVSGSTPGLPAPDGQTVPVEKLDALADAVSVCVNSAGGQAGDHSACGLLFTAATSDQGVAPTDVTGALLQIAQNPTRNVETIFDFVTPTAVFQPVLATAPQDWSLNLESTVPAPTANPAAGLYTNPQMVTLSDALAGTQIYYTVDGSTPTAASSAYAGPIPVTDALIVRSVALRSGVSSVILSANYNIGPAVSVTVSPASVALLAGQTQLFNAEIARAANPAVTWTLSPAIGSISATGLYTAPASVAASQVVTIRATSAADSTKYATAVVTLNPVTQSSGTFYIDNVAGNDLNDGLSPATAFATVAKVNSLTLTPGQTVAFRAGEEWHENLQIASSGAVGAPITYTAYGNGAQPILSASDEATGWTPGGGVVPQQSCNGSCVFSSGFEKQGLTDWTSVMVGNRQTDALLVSTASPAHGVSSLLATTTSGADGRLWVTKQIPAIGESSSAGFRFYLKTPAGSFKPKQHSAPLAIGYIGGNEVMNASVETDSQGNPATISVYDEVDGVQITPYEQPLTGYVVGGWNEIEVDFTVASSGGGASVYLNGNLLGTMTNLNTDGLKGLNNLAFGSLGYGVLAPGAEVGFDDVEIASGTLPIGLFAGGIPQNVWSHKQTMNPGLPMIGGNAGTPANSIGSLGVAGQYFWDGNATLYVYATENPDGTVETAARSNAVSSAGANYITLSGLELRGGTDTFLCGTKQPCGYWTFTGNTFDGAQSDLLGWRFDNGVVSPGLIISNNVFRGAGAAGIGIGNGGAGMDAAITNNTMYNLCEIYIAGSPENSYCDAINVFSQSGLDGGGYITGNTIHDVGLVSGAAYGGGIHPDTVTNWDIEHNSVTNTNYPGINIEKGSGSVARYNLLVQTGQYQYFGGLQIRAGDGLSVNNQLAEFNTVYGGWFACTLQITQNQGYVVAANTTMRNNICGGAASGTQFWADPGAQANGNRFLSSNFGPATSNFINFAGSAISVYSALDGAAGYTTESIPGDPQFVNPASNNFTLQDTSPAVSIGAFPLL